MTRLVSTDLLSVRVFTWLTKDILCYFNKSQVAITYPGPAIYHIRVKARLSFLYLSNGRMADLGGARPIPQPRLVWGL